MGFSEGGGGVLIDVQAFPIKTHEFYILNNYLSQKQQNLMIKFCSYFNIRPHSQEFYGLNLKKTAILNIKKSINTLLSGVWGTF